MTVEMETTIPPKPATRIRTWWLVVAAVVAVALAVGAGFYRHEKHHDVQRAAAQVTTLQRETRDLDAKVSTAKANLAASRQKLKARAARSAALLHALDRLKTNHTSESAFVHDQNATSAQIVDALAASRFSQYNDLADRFTSGAKSVNALADLETKLRDQLTAATCEDACGTVEASARSTGQPGATNG